MNAYELAKAVKAAEVQKAALRGHSVLVYGPPKAGKTELAATVSLADTIDNVYLFDNENGWETLIQMIDKGKLTEEAAKKIIVINISDTVREPHACETMIKALNSNKAPVYIRMSDGHLLPQKPMGSDPDVLEFQISKLTMRDVVIIDSGSQLGDSAMAGVMLGRNTVAKPEWDDYSAQGKWLGDMLSVMQDARYCNFILCTHQVLLPDEDGVEKFFPMMGTKNFCYKVAKYFGTVIQLKVKAGSHVGGSGSTYSKMALTGSRRGVLLEKQKELSLIPLFDASVKEQQAETTSTKPSGLAGLSSGRLMKK